MGRDRARYLERMKRTILCIITNYFGARDRERFGGTYRARMAARLKADIEENMGQGIMQDVNQTVPTNDNFHLKKSFPLGEIVVGFAVMKGIFFLL